MTKLEKTKANGADPLAPSKQYLAAEKHWRELDAARAQLINQIEGGKLALSLSRSPGDAGRLPERLKKLQEPYLKLAEDDPENLAERIKRAHRDLGALSDGDGESTFDAWQGAQRRETNRIAKLLQPAHRAAVVKMVKAVELLSQAIIAERAVLAELAERAPLGQSMFLPDLGCELHVGTLADYDSPLWRWARRVRELKIFK